MRKLTMLPRPQNLLGILLLGIGLHAAQAQDSVTVVLPPADSAAALAATNTPPPAPMASALPGSNTVPIGTIVAWFKGPKETPPLPADWVECNGQKLEMVDSPYDGTIIPNLNGLNDEPRRFLRGAEQAGETGGSETHDHGRFLVDREGERRVNISARNPAVHLPPYFEVTWIMKVR